MATISAKERQYKEPTNGRAARSAPSALDNVQIGEGRRRVVIEAVTPQIDGGRYPIKRAVGDSVVVEADAFADGHDELSCAVLYRPQGAASWREAPMEPLINDRWRGEFSVDSMGPWEYTVAGWVDRFKTWEHAMEKRLAAGQDVHVEMEIGALLVDEAANVLEAADDPASAATVSQLRKMAAVMRAGGAAATTVLESPELAALMATYLPRRFMMLAEPLLQITVDRERAAFSAWYELFPRSAASAPGQHGTFNDVIARLPYVAELGFDVLYMPPIHPIGRAYRKGKNNNVVAQPGEPGSPWAIGSDEGGHMTIHPELGTMGDFHRLVEMAKKYGIEIALDIAFQCAPDHPYVKEHPEWFRQRPDGTIQYAENPPKKYQDIYPFDFESPDWQGLWQELKDVFEFWIEQGVKIFRVDNPHTKGFLFWEWCIAELKRAHPEVLFLAEAFTRPKVMNRLAKLGFSQSYTYFTWRIEKWELTQYMIELTRSEQRDYFRPNFWPNTPDILTPQFYGGSKATFLARAALAATMTANWGMYGPLYELLQFTPVAGREEYIDSEKYEIHTWDLNDPQSIKGFIGRLNRIRRENAALQRNDSIRFHAVQNDYHENDQLIAYTKHTADLSNIVLTIINLDPYHTQAGWVALPLAELGLDMNQPFQVHDLISDARFLWQGQWNYVELNPNLAPVHIFVVRRVV